jgi:hypothetical protein
LEHRASMKRFVSLQFLNPKIVGRTPCTRNQPITRLLPTQTQNKRRHTSMPWVGIQTHNSSVWAGKDSSCLRPRGHCDQLSLIQLILTVRQLWMNMSNLGIVIDSEMCGGFINNFCWNL